MVKKLKTNAPTSIQYVGMRSRLFTISQKSLPILPCPTSARDIAFSSTLAIEYAAFRFSNAPGKEGSDQAGNADNVKSPTPSQRICYPSTECDPDSCSTSVPIDQNERTRPRLALLKKSPRSESDAGAYPASPMPSIERILNNCSTFCVNPASAVDTLHMPTQKATIFLRIPLSAHTPKGSVAMAYTIRKDEMSRPP